MILRMLRTTRALVAVALVSSLTAACGGDPCEELEEQCGSCSGSDTQSQAVEQACDAAVELDDDDVCEEALDHSSFECP
jgi:hypothetical protein